MFKISHVEIEGFWGQFSATIDFDLSVNILIGKNGTGKTTFMDMLQAVLRVDLPILDSLEFTRILIKLVQNSKRRTIAVTKEKSSEGPYDSVIFKIAKNSYTLALHPRETERYRYIERTGRLNKGYSEVKQAVDALINIASLSVHRMSHHDFFEDDVNYLPSRRQSERPLIDSRLEQLSGALTTYQLSLSKMEEEVSAKFQKDVLTSMLYDKRFDTLNLADVTKIHLDDAKRQLHTAYRDLGAFDEKTSSKIDQHFDALSNSITTIGEFTKKQSDPSNEENGTLNIDAIMPLPLLGRTQHIIELSLEANKKKQDISQPIQQFLKIAGEFIDDKELTINPSSGTLIVHKGSKQIPLLDLSSGEKQLLILLIETLLQKNEEFIFLADEPEISLHIEWQAKIISSIRELNSSSQIIVATHSPEIAAGWKSQLIDMEDIISG